MKKESCFTSMAGTACRCTDCKGRAGPCLYYVTERWRDYIVSSGGGRCQYPECVLYDKGNGYFAGYDDGIGHDTVYDSERNLQETE